MKFSKLLIISVISLLLVLPLIPGKAAVGLELSTSNGTVGFTLHIKGTGLTSGTHYIVIAEHSDGNLTDVATATGSTTHFKIDFTSEDTDEIVPIHLDTYNVTSGAAHGTDDVDVLFTLKAANIPGSEFFTGIVGPLLTIGIVIGIASLFTIKKLRK